MTREIPLYHWSPASRRVRILRRGLCPNSLSRSGEWRPPYVCLADSPSLGWALSGGFSDVSGDWDLWMVWSSEIKKLRRRLDGGNKPIEYRAFERIPKRLIWHVGVRHLKVKK